MADVIVIGGGLNGLVAGAWLAKRKFKTIVLEQRHVAGGGATTSEMAPGFKVPALSHSLGPVHRDVIRAFDLDRGAGLEFLLPDPALTALGRDHAHIVFRRDPVLTAGSIHRVSPHDAERWQTFLRSAQAVAGVVAAIQRHAPPSIDHTGAGDWWRLFGVGRRARGLGSRDLSRLLRWLPMAVADLVGESFDSDLVQAAIAARAIFGNFAGPRSAGTGAMLLQRMAEDPIPVGSGATVRGGPGALIEAIVAVLGRLGAEVRTDARVERLMTDRGRVTGVVLDNGTEIPARAVVAAIDPGRTFLHLVDPADLPPTFLDRVRHIRARGVTAKINLALSALPAFRALHGDAVPLRGRFLIAPDLNYLERAFDAAKYGEISADPWLELAMPSVIDPTLAPAGAHVMSVYAQFAPRDLRSGTWTDAREELVARVLRVLETQAPGIGRLIVGRDVLTPEDLEREWGMSGGHIFHGEPAIDQTWMARPLVGWAQYRTPIDGLFLASAGTHPGGGLTGMSGLLAGRTVALTLAQRR